MLFRPSVERLAQFAMDWNLEPGAGLVLDDGDGVALRVDVGPSHRSHIAATLTGEQGSGIDRSLARSYRMMRFKLRQLLVGPSVVFAALEAFDPLRRVVFAVARDGELHQYTKLL